MKIFIRPMVLSHVASRKAFAVVCLSVVCCLLSVVFCQLSVVSCQLSVVSCQLSVVKVSPFLRVENRRSDCVTPLQWTAVSMSLVSLYIEQPENICVRRTERQEPRAGYWRYRRRQLGSLLGMGGEDATTITDTLGMGGEDATHITDTLGMGGEDATYITDTLGMGGEDATYITDTLGMGGEDATTITDTARRRVIHTTVIPTDSLANNDEHNEEASVCREGVN